MDIHTRFHELYRHSTRATTLLDLNCLELNAYSSSTNLEHRCLQLYEIGQKLTHIFPSIARHLAAVGPGLPPAAIAIGPYFDGCFGTCCCHEQ